MEGSSTAPRPGVPLPVCFHHSKMMNGEIPKPTRLGESTSTGIKFLLDKSYSHKCKNAASRNSVPSLPVNALPAPQS